MIRKTWVIYDERAMTMGSDEASVLEACSSLREVKTSPWDGVDGPLGIVYEYDVTNKSELVNEQFLGSVLDLRGGTTPAQLTVMRRHDHDRLRRSWRLQDQNRKAQT